MTKHNYLVIAQEFYQSAIYIVETNTTKSAKRLVKKEHKKRSTDGDAVYNCYRLDEQENGFVTHCSDCRVTFIK
jgi:hypothetical protein